MFGAIGGFITFIIIAVIILFVLSTCIRVVPQAQALVVERLGAYLGTYSVGIHFLVPFIDRVAKKVNLKEQVEDFPPQPVITKDNVTMQIDTVVFFYITDPKLYAYGVERPLLAIENLTATTLRNIIGDLELDETLTSRRKARQRPSVPYRRLRRTVSALSRRQGLTMQFSSLRVWKHSRQLPTERPIRLSFLRISRELQAWSNP